MHWVNFILKQLVLSKQRMKNEYVSFFIVFVYVIAVHMVSSRNNLRKHYLQQVNKKHLKSGSDVGLWGIKTHISLKKY